VSIFITIAGSFFAMGFGAGLAVSMILLVQQAMKRAVNSSS
jgi:hypothetical protein